MMFTLLVDHANRSLSQLRGKLCLSVHGSIFSKVGASAKPGEVHSAEAIRATGTSKPTCAEVGVLFGENAEKIYDLFLPRLLFLIDGFSTDSYKDYHATNKSRGFVRDLNYYSKYFGGDIYDQRTFDAMHLIVENRFLNRGNVSILRVLSSEGVNALNANNCFSLDYLYLDASHHFETFFDDIVSYFPMLNENGLIQLNDCCTSSAGLAQNFGGLEAITRYLKTIGDDFIPMLLNNEDASDLVICRKGSLIQKRISDFMYKSELKFIEVPPSMLAQAKIVGRGKNLSFSL